MVAVYVWCEILGEWLFSASQTVRAVRLLFLDACCRCLVVARQEGCIFGPTRPLPRQSQVRVYIPSGLQSNEGPLPSLKDYEFRFRVRIVSGVCCGCCCLAYLCPGHTRRVSLCTFVSPPSSSSGVPPLQSHIRSPVRSLSPQEEEFYDRVILQHHQRPRNSDPCSHWNLCASSTR